jgi:hypothetical protein
MKTNLDDYRVRYLDSTDFNIIGYLTKKIWLSKVEVIVCIKGEGTEEEEELYKDLEDGTLSVSAAKEKLINEIKKLETSEKNKLFKLSEEKYKESIKERLSSKEITVKEAKAEVKGYIEKNKEEIKDSLDRKSEDTLINKMITYGKAIGTDPITAFNNNSLKT